MNNYYCCELASNNLSEQFLVKKILKLFGYKILRINKIDIRVQYYTNMLFDPVLRPGING